MRPVTDLQRRVEPFQVISDYVPAGDQPAAIEEIVRRIDAGEQDVVLLGATGTGKSATTAWLIERLQRPTLVLAPNKTLAAQLANEFRELMPNNAVEYFVSYYDYYQPEAYVPQTDTFIEKDSSVNDEVERLRHSATNSLLTRRDVIVVATVSCIYGLGTPQEYVDRMVKLRVGDEIDRNVLLRRFVDIQYKRNDMAFERGTFRVRGDTIEIIPMYEELALRIEMFGDEIEKITTLHPLTGEIIRDETEMYIFPATHYAAGPETIQRAIGEIETELATQLEIFEKQGKLLEAQRLRMRTTFDIEMMQQLGFCSGIENYSRQLDGRPAGSAPNCLLDYFPEDFLVVIDESHVTVPQIGAMFEGDASRKRTLVEHGFRLPSAMDNRPLRWPEFLERVGQKLYLSATPGPYELGKVENDVVEQVIRPTGLVDPQIIIKPIKGQIDDLLVEINIRAARNERVLVTTLTKKMSEDLTEYLQEKGVRIWNEWADENGELGPVYGYQWRSWPTPDGRHIDQVTQVVNSIKNKPDSRRHLISAWNVGQIDQMKLPPCHLLVQFYVAEGKLSCQLYQRSADIFLGVPFNIASYALLTLMMAQVCGLQPGEFIHTLGDAHIYLNHMEQVKLQLSREPYPLPQMKINPDVKSIFDFRYEDFELTGYQSHPHIPGAVAV